MELSNSSKYAIRLLSYMANHADEEKLLSAKDMADILEIPYKFSTRIMSTLVKAGFILSLRGRVGGVKLAKKPSEITIMEIINLFNDFIKDEDCLLGIGSCDCENKCSLHDQWKEPKLLMKHMFTDTTLEDVKGDEFKV